MNRQAGYGIKLSKYSRRSCNREISYCRIVKEVSNARFVILGEGNLRAKLERQCQELGIRDFIFMPGVLVPAIDFIADLSVFVLTSKEEGTFNALLEAMMAGLSCVVSDIAPNRELIVNGKDGFLVDVNDVREFSDVLIKLLLDQKLREILSRNAQHVIRTKWSVNEMVPPIG